VGEGQGNHFGGEAHNVAQVGAVYGNVVFPGPSRVVEVADQFTPPVDHYTNNERQLDEITAGAQHRGDRDGPRTVLIRGTPGSGRSALARCWGYKHREEYPGGRFAVRLGPGAERTRDVLADLLAQLGYLPDEIPASLEGRSAMWQNRTADERIVLVIDDAVTPAQVRPLIPGPGRSLVLVVESGNLKELCASHSATYVRIDPLTDKASGALLVGMIGTERREREPAAFETLIGHCAGSAAALNVVGEIGRAHV
jgi:hypothetical protein